MPARTFSGAPAFAPAIIRPRQMTVAYLGDSLTSGATATYNYGDAYPTYATIAAQGRIVPAGFYGVGGQRSDQILARVQDALATRPSYLAALAGTNDIGQGISNGQTDAQIIQTIKANLTAMYRAAEAVGTVPVAITIPPNNSTSNANRRQVLIIKANIWIRRHAAIKGYPLVDFYTLLVKDGLTATPAGTYKDLYALDGTHPNAVGCNAMGILFAQSLDGTAPPVATPFLAVDSSDQAQAVLAIKNPLWLGSTGSPAKFPDNGGAFGAPVTSTTTTYSLTSDFAIPGNVLNMAMSATATQPGGYSSAGFPVAQGDVIAVAGNFTTDGIGGVTVQLVLNGTTYRVLNLGSANLGTGAITRGLYYMEIKAPAASTGNVVNLLSTLRSGLASNVSFGYPTVVNLTQAIGATVPITPN